MALTGEEARAVYRSAVGVLRSSRRGISEGALAHRLIALRADITGQPFAAFQAIARQAMRGVAAAERMTELGNGILPTRELPRGPASGVDGQPVNYRVFVRIQPTNGGEEILFSNDLTEPGSISSQAIRDYVDSHMIDFAYKRTRKNEVRALNGNYTFDIEILSASR